MKRPFGSLLLFLVPTMAVVYAFTRYDWGCGLTRLALLLLLGGIVLGSEVYARNCLGADSSAPVPGAPKGLWRGLAVVAAGLLLVNLALGLGSIYHAARTGDVRLDQGQACWRAAKVLWTGQNPYGRHVFFDYPTYEQRALVRQQLHVPSLPLAEAERLVSRYWETLDPALRDQLLPPLPPASVTLEMDREQLRYSFKYGPNIPLLFSPLVPLLGASVDAIFNLGAYLLFIVTFYKLLPIAGVVDERARLVIMIALLGDTHVQRNFLYYSATDIYALSLCSLAVLLSLRGRQVAPGALVALAVGTKAFPAALFLPWLARQRTWRPIAVFVLVALVNLLPFLLWEPFGFVYNVYLHSALRSPDSTSWIYFAPQWLVLTGKVVCYLVAAYAALRIWRGGRGTPWFYFFLITLCAVVSSQQFHNNYLAWCSPFAYLALGASFFAKRAVAPTVGGAA